MARERDRERGRKGSPADKRRIPKKKVSILNAESITYIDYKDVNLLRRFMSERAKIRARRVTGNSAQQQREVAKAIRLSREMALLPYAVRQVTQRGGKGRGRERGGERDREMPRESIAAPMTAAEAALAAANQIEQYAASQRVADDGAGLDLEGGILDAFDEEEAE